METKKCCDCTHSFDASRDFFPSKGKGRIGPRCRHCSRLQRRTGNLGEKRRLYARQKAASLREVKNEKYLICLKKSVIDWRRRHPEQVRAYNLAAYDRRSEAPGYRAHAAMARRIRYALSDKAKQRTLDLIGYSLDELMRHIERQFQSGMTWENYGQKWHIDHIVPVREFKFTTAQDADFAACWALTNLRPLWKKANLSKGGKRLHLL